MARFFFHILEGSERTVEDEEGSVFPDLEAARKEAVETARELLAEDIRRGIASFSAVLEVTDAEGTVVITLPFSAAVEVR